MVDEQIRPGRTCGRGGEIYREGRREGMGQIEIGTGIGGDGR